MAIALSHVSVPSSQSGSSPLSFAITTSTGNLMIVGLIVDPALTVTGVTDSKGQTYTPVGVNGTDATTGKTYFFYKLSSATGVTSISVAFSGTGAVAFISYDCSSTTGGASDTQVPFSTQTTASPSMSITASAAGICVAIEGNDSGASVSVATPFTLDGINVGSLAQFGGAAHDVNSGGGSLIATFTDLGDTHWNGVIATFKEAGTAAVTIVGPAGLTEQQPQINRRGTRIWY